MPRGLALLVLSRIAAGMHTCTLTADELCLRARDVLDVALAPPCAAARLGAALNDQTALGFPAEPATAEGNPTRAALLATARALGGRRSEQGACEAPSPSAVYAGSASGRLVGYVCPSARSELTLAWRNATSDAPLVLRAPNASDIVIATHTPAPVDRPWYSAANRSSNGTAWACPSEPGLEHERCMH